MDFSCTRCCGAAGEDAEVITVVGSSPSDSAADSGLPKIPDAPTKALDAGESLQSPRPPATVSKDAADVDRAVASTVASEGPRLVESTMITATVNKGERKLGVDINYHDNMTLLVTKVHAGPVDDYNKDNPGQELSPGDRIIGVNGVLNDTQQMLEACRISPELKLMVKRCEERIVKFDSGGGRKLGIDFCACDNMTLLIEDIAESGLIAEHNEVWPDIDIQKYDRIIGVNGVRSDAAQLLSAMGGEPGVRLLTIRRVWPK